MNSTEVNLSEIKSNPNNPRIIKDDKFHKLVESIKTFPRMLEIRPIVVNKDMIVLGGNMRLKACKEAGIKKVHVIFADDLTEEQQREFIIKDNVGFGEWDWAMLANEWDYKELDDWGLTLPNFDDDNNKNDKYTTKTDLFQYEPKGEKPKLNILYNDEKLKELILNIEKSSVSEDEKNLLKMASYRHVSFDFEKIAEYYCHANKEMQELIEQNALVIIDINDAISNGFVEMTKELRELSEIEND